MDLIINAVSGSDCRSILRAEWETLALHAVDANPFYEYWAFLPALRLAGGDDVCLLSVREPSSKRLIGIFPLIREQGFRGIPVYRTSLWRHPYCYLCTPLVHKEWVPEVLREVLQWIQLSDFYPTLCTWYWLQGDGALVSQLRSDIVDAGSCKASVRACLSTEGSYETEFVSKLRKRKRKEWARSWRRFHETGKVEFDFVTQHNTAEQQHAAISDFLTLEHLGWKGECGTSLLSLDQTTKFFTELMQSGFDHNQAIIGRITRDGVPCAMITVIVSANGREAYTLKIASDPALHRFSLGSQIVLQLTEYLFAHPTVGFVDSCAAEKHPMINWLWSGRRQISQLNLSNGDLKSKLLIPLTAGMLTAVTKSKSYAHKLRKNGWQAFSH